MEQRVPRGRGAALMEAFKRRQEREREAQVGAQQEAPPEEPPKPRGRAALLQKLQESRLKKVGASGGAPQASAAAAPAPAVVAKPTASPQVEEVTAAMKEVTIRPSEPVTFKGESGKQFKVSANYIRLAVDKGRGVFEYEVRFDPEIDAKNRRIKMLHSHMQEMGSVKVFDGGSVLYLPQKITDTEKVFIGKLPDSDVEITTKVIYKRKKTMGECLHLYNVLFKRIMHVLLFNQMGRNYFDMNHKHPIPQHRLEVLPGYAVSVDEMEDGLMLCLDTQHRVLRTQSAYELLQELTATFPRNVKEQANNHLIGSCVFTRYNNKTYIVDDIAWEMNPQDTFETRDGGVISFIDYYKNQYNITINDENQPLLIHRRTVKVSGSAEKVDRMVCLVPELSYLTGLTDAMRNDFKVMKDVAMYTRVTPHQRLIALRKYLDSVSQCEKAQQILGDWGLKIAGGTLDMCGRQLENEVIWFGGERMVKCNDNADWNRGAGEYPVAGSVDLHRWIVFYTQKDGRNAKDFAQTMVRMADVMGCRIANPKLIMMSDDRTESYLVQCRNNITSDVQAVVFIVPTLRNDRYSVIKRVCCTQLPVASQVIISKTLCNPKRVRSIIQKIAMQINCKLGGTLWTVRFPFKGWMIAGIDVYHAKGSPSVCGFVASLNESISRWFSVAQFQEKELGDHFKVAFIKSLEHWRNENGFYPSKLVIFRDGVGDGQLDHCKRYEIEQFLSVLKEFDLETTLCFVVVQKRINQRIFSVSREGAENPPPGTVVDHTITRRHLKDFFLVSQSTRQGTVNPTHYIVLHDGCNLKPDHVQRLAYKLCHLYYNWAGTIRVPAPCQYAHKLAGLVGQNIKSLPSAQLSDKLFYL